MYNICSTYIFHYASYVSVFPYITRQVQCLKRSMTQWNKPKVIHCYWIDIRPAMFVVRNRLLTWQKHFSMYVPTCTSVFSFTTRTINYVQHTANISLFIYCLYVYGDGRVSTSHLLTCRIKSVSIHLSQFYILSLLISFFAHFHFHLVFLEPYISHSRIRIVYQSCRYL